MWVHLEAVNSFPKHFPWHSLSQGSLTSGVPQTHFQPTHLLVLLLVSEYSCKLPEGSEIAGRWGSHPYQLFLWNWTGPSIVIFSCFRGYLWWLVTHCPNTWVLLKAHVNASTQLPERWQMYSLRVPAGIKQRSEVVSCLSTWFLLKIASFMFFWPHHSMQVPILRPHPRTYWITSSGWGRGPRQFHRVTGAYSE